MTIPCEAKTHTIINVAVYSSRLIGHLIKSWLSLLIMKKMTGNMLDVDDSLTFISPYEAKYNSSLKRHLLCTVIS